MEPSYTLEITGLAYGGEAFGRLDDGRAVFVPFALPGETVRVSLIEQKRSFARARLLEVMKPAQERIQPLCRHFGECGGCHYQHMPYAAQLEAKRSILRDQLERIGGLKDVPVQPTVPSPHEYYYRNHVQFHLTPEGKLGYHRWRSETVFEVKECHLPEAPIHLVWPQLDFEAMPELERIGLRLGAGDDIQLVLENSQLETPELSIEELDLSAVHLSPAGALVLAGSGRLEMEVLGREFAVSAGSFFQVNNPMAESMVRHVLDLLPGFHPLTLKTTLLDVYCGVGLFSAFLAPQVGQLIGIEASASACEDFVDNLDEFENVSLYEAAAEDVLPSLEAQPEVVLVDPPRAGIERRAMDGLLRLSPQVIAYISCDPSTLARDAKKLVAAGYRLAQITPFDLFPQTFHIESISFWTKTR